MTELPTMEQEHFSKAPIIEAIIDLRVSLPLDFNLEQLSKVGEIISINYPVRNSIITSKITLEHNPTLRTDASIQPNGYVFVSADKQRVLQLQPDGFTFKLLPPYDTWENFQSEAHELWNTYCRVCQPHNVTRVAVLYVNRLDLPLPFLDFKEYLRVVPEIPGDLPQIGLSGYFMQLQLPQPDIAPDCMLLLNQAMVPPVVPDTIAIVLDFDLFYTALRA